MNPATDSGPHARRLIAKIRFVWLRCAPILLTIRNAGVCRLFIAHAGCINSASDALQSLGARSADAKRHTNSRRLFARSKHAQVLLRHDDKHRRTHRVISHGTTLTANGHEECACAQGTHVMRNCLHLRHILLRQIRAHVCAHVTTQNTFAHEQIYILSAGPSGQVTLERTVIPPRATSACDVYRTEHILARQSIRVVRLNHRHSKTLATVVLVWSMFGASARHIRVVAAIAIAENAVRVRRT